MWSCPKCGEQHEEALRMCWRCGTDPANYRPFNVLELLAEPTTRLLLKDYLALIQDLPLPTPEQKRNFVEFVTSAHSWYKHLPRWLPGAPFYFYLDKFAGCDCVALQDGSRAMVEREVEGFHYSDIPTRQYRARFGHLNYSCARGTAVLFPGAGATVIPRDKVVAIPGEDGHLFSLPQPVLEAGRANLTAMIHPRSPIYDFWDAGKERQSVARWPRESGGEAVVKKIFERCAEMRRPEYEKQRMDRHDRMMEVMRKCQTTDEMMAISERAQADPVLYELMQPERERQKAEMLKAIDRVCMLIMEAGLTR